MFTHALLIGSEWRRAVLVAALLSALAAASLGLTAGAPSASASGRPATAGTSQLPPAPAPPKGFFGVSGRHLGAEDLDGMQEAGVGIYRSLFNFSVAKRRQKGFYDWTEFDKLVGRTAARGIQLLPLLYGTPRWIYADGSTPPIYDERARQAWAHLLRQLANRYGPRGIYWGLHPFVPYRPILTWQIWNEPNSDSFWQREPDPYEYAKLVALSAHAIHSVNPRATIVSAGIVADPEGPGSMPGPEYLEALASQPLARRTIDKYGYHPYAWNAPGVKQELREARAVLATHDPGAPIWVTEVGWGSDFLLDRMLLKTPAGQAKALKTTFAMTLRKRKRLGIQRMLWYYWRDHEDPFCLWCRSAGLLERGFERKPAFSAFKSIARR